VNLNRAEKGGGNAPIFSKSVTLSNSWHDYSFDFTANENGHNIGTVGLGFSVGGGEVLLDDVSLEHVSSAKENPTAFRDEVVETLRALQPGILRYQDGDHIGSTIDNLIAPPFARVRNGFSEGGSEQKQIPMGLQEFLQLCQVIHAEPWFNMPAGISPDDTRKLVEYLAGPATSPYGAKRAARGQNAPWTSVFPVIHLELGNEEWNAVTFAGAAMNDPVVYGQQAKMIFATARSSPFYDPKKFDLVIGSFALIPDMTRKELAASGGYDTTAVAPYTFNRFDDDSSDEAIFGPMMAQPEMLDSRPGSYMAEQWKAANSASHPAALSVYEENIGTSAGSAKQASFDRTIPSMGAGLALVDHMLLQLRDLGIKDQMVWSLAGFVNGFENSADHSPERTPLYGVVVDMGGPTNLRRPQYLAEKLANEALLPTMLETRMSGANPTWNQPKSANEDIQLDHAHYLQSFAFADGTQRSLVVLNLSRSKALPVTFSGDAAPAGSVVVSRLTAKNISDTNEHQDNVHIVKDTAASFDGHVPYSLPPFSMTVFQWTAEK
jgi:alpha-L-arabinofuranosidase